jgi:hypothetical protein
MSPGRRSVVCALALALLALGPCTPAWGLLNLEWGTAPALPTLPTVTLDATAQTVSTTMTNFSVSDTRLLTSAGWNVRVEGQSGAGKSAVFAQYCAKAKCGSDSEGYVPAGQALAANSLNLNSTGAKFTGGGAAPTLQCSAGCNLDSPSAVKIASAATGGAGAGTWTATGWAATSLQLSAQTTLRRLLNEEVYRVNLIWTLASGP